MADRVTRASNASAHPGIVDRAPSRRSKEEVAMAKQEKATAKARTEKQKSDNIQRVAKLESAAKQKKREMERQANNPVDKITQPRAKRTRNQETVNEGTTCDHEKQLTDIALTMDLGLKGEETPHAVKKPRTRESGSSNASVSASQNDGEVITY
jgi:hypothetical protein